ncbi:isochorismatase family protein [Rhodomicrobium lacus]|uniref:isochorismatase family protein n=1 Tax=Rhodomicrobium lacus TaxID=2498452 RepID=UPI000F8D721B|nr:isochorismatase family protein [Rhodomicrobium lacus]
MAIPRLADYPMPLPPSFPMNKTNWRPDPKRAAFLIHDMQRYFLGFYEDESILKNKLIKNLASLRRWAKENGVPVIYTAQPHTQSTVDRGLLNHMWGAGLTEADPDLQQIVPDLAPNEEDIVLTKWRYSAFRRTSLLEQMKSAGRDQLLIGGVYAHIGCMVTAVDAFMSDIQPFIIGDAVADFSEAEHRMALDYVARRCGSVIATEALIETSAASTVTRDWLEARVRGLLEDATDLDPNENLLFYGIDSLQVMRLASELKARGVLVSFEDLARAPTLNAWWELIDRKCMAA